MSKRVIISQLIRRLVFAAQITDTAETFVKQYLKPYLRDEILDNYTYKGYGTKGVKGKKDGLKIGRILAGVMSKVGGDAERKQKILEDIAFDFARPMKDREYFVGETGSKIRALLVQAADKDEIPEPDAHKIINRGGGVWDNADIENFENLREDFIKIINKYLTEFFRNAFLDMVKKKETQLSDDLPEADAETKEFIKDFEEYIEGETGSDYDKGQSKAVKTLGFSVKDLRDFIEDTDTVKGKFKELYKVLLDDNILKKKGEAGYKTYEDIAEQFGFVDEAGKPKKQNVYKHAVKLEALIKNLRTQKKHEQGETEKKGADMEAVLPYGIINAESDLIQKLEDQDKAVQERKESPDFLRVKYEIKKDKGPDLESLKKELATEEAKKGQERIPKKIERLKKEVADLEKGEDLKVERSIATKTHVNLINTALKRNKVKAIIQFSAAYDNETILKKDGPDPDKVKVDFKYENYTAHFKGKQKGATKKGKWVKTVDYTLSQPVTDEGDVKGEGKSTLKIDGEITSADDKLKKTFDEYVRENMISEGMLPYGQSVAKPSENVKFPAKYINTELEKKYFGADSFFNYYQGLLTEDISQKKRKEIAEKRQKQLSIGRSTEDEILDTISLLKNELSRTEIDEKSEVEKQIKDLQKTLKDVKDVDFDKESEIGIGKSRNFLLEKKKGRLENVTEELRTENSKPKEEQDRSKLRTLTKSKANLEKAIKHIEDGLREKKSSLIPIAEMLRDVHAASKEYMELSKKLTDAQEALKDLKELLRKSDSTPSDISRLIKLRQDSLKTLTREQAESAKEEIKILESLYEKMDKDWNEKADDAETEKGKKRLKVVEDHKEKLKKKIEDKEAEIEDFKNQMEKSEGKPGVFPKTESEQVKEFYKILEDAGVKRFPKMTVYGWLSPVQFKQMAKQMQAVIRTKYKEKIDDMKAQKGISPEEREVEIRKLQKAHAEELAKVKSLISALPADLKKRRDQFKKDHPGDFDRLQESDWVDNESKVKEVIQKAESDLGEIKEETKSKKAPSVNILEKNKFYSLGDFLTTAKSGLGTLAGRLEKAPLEPAAMPGDLKSSLTSYLEKVTSGHAKAKKILSDTTKALEDDAGDEAKGQLEALTKDFKKAEKHLSGAKNILTHFESEAKRVPALLAAKALLDKVGYFSYLYNYYSSILWFGEKGVLPTTGKKAEEDTGFTKDDIDDLKEIRDDAVDTIETLASTPLTNKEEIKREVLKAKKELALFIDGYDNYAVPREAPRVAPPTQQKFRGEIPSGPPEKKASLPYEVITADKREEMKETMIFPADQMKEITTLLGNLGRKSEKLQADAKAELVEVKKNVKDMHEGEGKLTKKELGPIVKVEKGSLSDTDYAELKERALGEAAAVTGQVIDRINRDMLNKFITKWEEIYREENTKKKHDGLNRRPPAEYKDMWEWVDDQMPGLSKEAPEETRLETPGKPTEVEIRKHYEDAFEKKKLPVSDATLTDMAKIFKKEFQLPEGGGGGGGKSKGRAKPIKNAPAKGTFEVVKENLVKIMKKHNNGHDVVMEVLDDYVFKLKKMMKKEDFYIGGIVDGMVSLLKNVLFTMKAVQVGRPESTVKLPPAMAPKSIGKPDITIQTDKEADDTYDKMVEMIETVNDFTDPDVVSIPHETLKNLKKTDQYYLPAGLIGYYGKPEKETREPEIKKSSSQSLAFKLAQKFAFTEIQSIDSLTEEDILITE